MGVVGTVEKKAIMEAYKYVCKDPEKNLPNIFKTIEKYDMLFTMDFQNDGEFVGGCIAGGRNYCHINSNGDVEPCVFIHYSSANIKNEDLLDCLRQPLFQKYRENQPFNENMSTRRRASISGLPMTTR